MTLEIKLIIAAILLALIGYEQYWVYDQGRSNGKAQAAVETVKAVKQALQDSEEAFRALRQREMRDAAETSKQLLLNEQKKTNALRDANAILKKNQVFADAVVPTDLVVVLNLARGGPGS